MAGSGNLQPLGCGEFARFASRRIAAKGCVDSKSLSFPNASAPNSAAFVWALATQSYSKLEDTGSPTEALGDDVKMLVEKARRRIRMLRVAGNWPKNH